MTDDRKTETCPHCHGNGYVNHPTKEGGMWWQTQLRRCGKCNGSGLVWAKEPEPAARVVVCEDCDGTGIDPEISASKGWNRSISPECRTCGGAGQITVPTGQENT